MSGNRREILGMVAAGRITAWEGERLLAAWNEERESRWIFGACAAPALVSFLHSLWLQAISSGALHAAWVLLSGLPGGMR